MSNKKLFVFRENERRIGYFPEEGPRYKPKLEYCCTYCHHHSSINLRLLGDGSGRKICVNCDDKIKIEKWWKKEQQKKWTPDPKWRAFTFDSNTGGGGNYKPK